MFEIIGYEHVTYTAKNTGEVVSGYRLYLTGDEVSDGDGLTCSEVFIRTSMLDNYSPVLGDRIFIMRDQRGFVRGVYKP